MKLDNSGYMWRKKVDASGWKWMIMDETKLKWIKVAASGKKIKKRGQRWIQVNNGEYKGWVY